MQSLSTQLSLARKATASLLVLTIFSFSITVLGQMPQTESPQVPEVVVPDGTEFDVVTIEEISSKTASEGDPLTFKVADDVKIGGQVVIAKDTIVKGTVSSAEKSGHMGKSGKLGIRVESTTAVDGQKVRLRASKGKQGDDKTGSVIALTILVSPLFLLKHGKDAKIKPGTKIRVYSDEETKVKIKV
jgi:hypothetical protein